MGKAVCEGLQLCYAFLEALVVGGESCPGRLSLSLSLGLSLSLSLSLALGLSLSLALGGGLATALRCRLRRLAGRRGFVVPSWI